MHFKKPIFLWDVSECNYFEKIITIRKPCKCCICKKELMAGSEMLIQKAIDKEGWYRCYICCLSCTGQL